MAQGGECAGPYRVFSDPDIYNTERDRVFLGPTWQYLGLAGELPNIGDYKTTFIGETPVIVSRAEDGQIHAMLNRCAHRGNLVCLSGRGTAMTAWTCVYHSWRYDLSGNLTSVAFRRGVAGKGGMPDSFQSESHGLKKLRVDQFAGLVFGTLSEEAPPLSDYIGNNDRRADRPGHAAASRKGARHGHRRFCTTTGSSTSRTSRTLTTPVCCTASSPRSGSAG